MTTQFAAGRSQLPSLAAYITGSGNVMGGGATYYFFLQGRARCGYNQASESFSLVVTDNSTVGCVIPGISYLASEDWHEFLVYANTADDFDTAWLVGTYKALQANQTTRTTLGSNTPLSSDPKQLVLTENYHLNFSSTVAAPANLPVVPLQGMRRFVTSLSRTYRYDADSTLTANGDTVLTATTGRWLFSESNNLVENPTNLYTDSNGCNQNINVVSGNPDLLLATYDVSGNTGTPIRYYLRSASNTTIPKGTIIKVSARIDDLDVTADLSGFLDITVFGKVQFSDYALVTTNFLSAGSSVPYDHFTENIILEDDILADEALLLSIAPSFAATEIDTNITPSVGLSLYPYFDEATATYSDSNLVVGDIIFNELDSRLVVPYGLGTLKTLTGSGCVNLYTWRNKPAVDLTGYTTVTADQIVVVTRTGDILLATPTAQRLQRALFSTVAGYSTPCAFSTPSSITSGQTLDYTLNIDLDVDGFNPISPVYSDPLLRGLPHRAKLNTNKLLLIVKVDSVYKSFVVTFDPELSAVSGTISNWSAGTTITTGDIADFDKDLFKPLTATHMVGGTGGTIPSGSVSIAYSFYYDGTSVSDISHSTEDGCITTQTITDADLGARYLYWGEGVADITALRAIEKEGDSVTEARYVASKRHPYHYDSTSTLTDDGDRVIQPDDITASGRWLADYSNAWFTGTTIPSGTLGDYGDWYLRSDTADLYRKNDAGTWILNSNIRGISGTVWRSGSGVPSNGLGINGDYYLNTDNGDVYTKASGIYTLTGSIQGVQGSVWRNGSGVPSNSLGIAGDYYLDSDTGSIYYKASTAYALVGVFSGTSTTSSLSLNNLGSVSTTSDQIGLLNQGNSLVIQDASNGAKHIVAVLDKSQVYRKSQIEQPVLTPFSSTVSIDASLGNTFDIALTGDITLENPTGLRNGQILRFRCTEDTTGTRTVSYDTLYDFGSAGTPIAPIDSGKMDIVTCISDGLGLACSIQTGYSYTPDPTSLLLSFAGSIEDWSKHYHTVQYDVLNDGTDPCTISVDSTKLIIENPTQVLDNNYARLLVTPTNTSLSFLNEDFTLELWATVDFSGGTYIRFIGDTSSNWEIGFDLITAKPTFTYNSVFTAFDTIMTDNTLAHIAVYRIGSDIYTALDGIVCASPITGLSSNPLGGSALPLYIGVKDSASLTTGYGIKGFIHGIKLTKGVALYTSSDFTSPSAP